MSRADRLDEIRRLFKPYAGGSFCEIGSTLWREWIDEAGVSPGNLVCVNVSEEEIGHGVEAAARSRVAPLFAQLDAHRLAFADDSFDVVFGGHILHHLDYGIALDEIRRVLRPGGLIVFAEPLDMNPVARIIRMRTPDARTDDEEPIRMRHLGMFRERFDIDLIGEQLLTVPASVVSTRRFDTASNPVMRSARAADRVLGRVPGVRLVSRHALIVGSALGPASD